MKLLLTGGGTGGHIYPALAIAEYVKTQDEELQVLYIGTQNGLEADIVNQAGYDMEYINISGLSRKLLSLHNFKLAINFLLAARKAKTIIKKFNPDLVIGTGGYVSAPVIMMANNMNIPTMIHEQNAVPGLTNKVLAKNVDLVATSFESSNYYFKNCKKVVLTGNPRASQVIHADSNKGRAELGINNSKKIVLVLGGSRGAEPINDCIAEIINNKKHSEWQIVFVTGRIHFNKFASLQDINNSVVINYVYNMPDVLAAADLVVSRAGATFLSELLALGKAAIIIPSPYVANDHQTKNAKYLSDNGAAVMIAEKNLNSDLLYNEINKIILDDEHRNKMKKSALQLAYPSAVQNIYQEMLKIIKK